MIMSSRIPPTIRALAAGLGVAVGAYVLYAGVAWYRYGHASEPRPDERDERLDRFMPSYDVVERHHIHVAAPAAITLDAGKQQDLRDSAIVRAIFKARETVLGATPDHRPQPGALLAAVQSLGWGVLADVPDREIVMGAVTKPWEANVTFRALPPDDFASFSQPGFVKIAWTLRADAIDAGTSVFRTETRALATDATARLLFRRYWACAAPGIALIRRLSLGPLKREAERRAREVHATAGGGPW
jgi:hypothetical protein